MDTKGDIMAKQRSMYGKDDLYVTDRSNPNATRVNDVQKWRTNQDDIRHLPGALPMQKLAIQDGAISPSAAFIVVDTEGGAPADDLTAINPGDLHDGMELELISADSSRVVTIKNSTAFSGIRTIRGEDIVLGMSYVFRLKLVSTESITYWQELPTAVKISDSVSFEDSNTAASSKAVKTAYDRGTSGLEAAASAQTTADTALEAAASAQTTADSKVSNIGGHIISLYWNEELSSPIWRTDETDFELAVKVKSATYLSIGSSQTAYAPSGGEWFCIIFRIKKDIVSGEDFSSFIVGNSTCGFYSGGQHILSTGSGDMAVIFCLQTKR